MEKFVLAAFLFREELDVVDKEHVGIAIAFAERGDVAVAERVNIVVYKRFRRNVDDLRRRIVLDDKVRDCVHQVGFAQARIAVEKQRVERLAHILGDGKSRRVRERVAFANDEVFECVARIYRNGRFRSVGDGANRGAAVVFGLGNGQLGRLLDDYVDIDIMACRKRKILNENVFVIVENPVRSERTGRGEHDFVFVSARAFEVREPLVVCLFGQSDSQFGFCFLPNFGEH